MHLGCQFVCPAGSGSRSCAIWKGGEGTRTRPSWAGAAWAQLGHSGASQAARVCGWGRLFRLNTGPGKRSRGCPGNGEKWDDATMQYHGFTLQDRCSLNLLMRPVVANEYPSILTDRQRYEMEHCTSSECRSHILNHPCMIAALHSGWGCLCSFSLSRGSSNICVLLTFSVCS